MHAELPTWSVWLSEQPSCQVYPTEACNPPSPCVQLFALPAVGKVLAVIAVALPIVLVGGLLYRKAAGDCSWQEALARTYSVLNNCPGKLLPYNSTTPILPEEQ